MKIEVSEVKGISEWMRDHEEWIERVWTGVGNAVEETAYRIERDARMIVPVDTGDLRKSIETEIDWSSSGRGEKVSAEIGTDLEYSDDVEFGTSRQMAQPYLIPSFDKNVADLERNINKILGG